ncbi:MAG: hypothetical protein K6D02_00540 [Lachnospiraceae bacterium]|nr:hypothetical protein [Lachnospiraceae bacterium]
MNNLTKTMVVVGLTTVLAIAVAVPVFSNANSKDVSKIAKSKFKVNEKLADNEDKDETSDDAEELAADEEFELDANATKNLTVEVLDKYDPEMQDIAKKYMDEGYYLTDLAESNKAYGTGFKNPNAKEGESEYFIDGFDVADTNDGNNTVYIAVIKMSNKDFKAWLPIKITDDKVEKKGDIVKASLPKEKVDIEYNKKTKIMTYKCDIGEGIG